MQIVNTEIIRNPYNWIIVWLMVTIGFLSLTLLTQSMQSRSLSNS